MQKPQRHVQARCQYLLLLGVGPNGRLDRLDVPVAKVSPEEIVQALGVLAELVRFERGVSAVYGTGDTREYPSVGQRFNNRWPFGPTAKRGQIG